MIRLWIVGIIVGLAVLLAGLEPVHARPEYAVKHATVSCTACHASPTGGGIRNSYGKMYGSRNLGYSKHSLNSWYQGDFRMIGYFPNNPDQVSTGAFIMASLLSANVPVTEKASGAQTSFVAELGVGGRGGFQSRRAFVHWQPASDLIQNVALGQFNVPFGLLTDEHKTYTRLQTASGYNDEYTGVMVSGEPFSEAHYDVAITNNYGVTESSGPSNQILTGSYVNFRWVPSYLPMYLGFSGSYHSRQNNKEPYAASAYLALSFDRLTNNYFSGALLVEAVQAKYWNDINSSDLKRHISDNSTLASATADSESMGYYGQLTWDFHQRFSLLYKYDYLAFDKDFSGDAFIKHGVGFRHFASSNFIVQLRAEHSMVNNSDISEYDQGKQKIVWLLGHLWF